MEFRLEYTLKKREIVNAEVYNRHVSAMMKLDFCLLVMVAPSTFSSGLYINVFRNIKIMLSG